MKRWMLGLGVVAVLAGTWPLSGSAQSPSRKFAIVLQAGTKSQDGMARAVHAFLYAKELKEHGHDVVLIFDGAGTTWAQELMPTDSTSKIKLLYDEFIQSGSMELVCDHCATAFGVHEDLAGLDAPLVSEYAGHPSIAKWVDKGYELLIL